MSAPRVLLGGLCGAIAAFLFFSGMDRARNALDGITLAELLQRRDAVSTGKLVGAARDAAASAEWQHDSATAFLFLAERAHQRGMEARSTYLEGAISVLRHQLARRPADGIAWARLAWATSFFAERGQDTDHALRMAQTYAPHAIYLTQVKFEAAARAWPDLSILAQQGVLRMVREAWISADGRRALRRGYSPPYSVHILERAFPNG